jgi:hypothetical protein
LPGASIAIHPKKRAHFKEEVMFFFRKKDSDSQPELMKTTQLRRLLRGLLIAVFTLGTTLAMIVPGVSSTLAASAGPNLAIDVSADRHTISSDIYGVNYWYPQLDASLAQELKFPVVRWGGNATSRYNWQVDSSNSGSDWYFMGGNGQATVTPGASSDAFVTTNKANSSKSMLTIPMLPYINKTSATNCSYPSSLYPDQQAWEPYTTLPDGSKCGNGKDLNGNPITDTNITLNHIANSPEYQKTWLQHLVSTHGTANQGGVQYYSLDNEPALWPNTHYDVHPDPLGYDELTNLSQSYGSMIKSVDPGAKIFGPADWGWCAYFGLCDNLGKSGDNRASHNDADFGQYYLQKMREYEQQHGVRLLDYFDEHYYPQASGIAFGSAGDANTQALRLRSTRSLWDPTYVDESWINQQVQLIPRFHEWINNNYPGTKLAITEYNWGALDSINGALAEADVLGIFGREQVDLATMWGAPTSSQPAAYAFRMYLNYDGQGSRYGNTWIRSTSSDQDQLAVYGAQRSSDKALTLMILNKTADDLTSSLSLAGATPTGNAQVYSYSGANLNAIVRQSDIAVGSSGFSATYPANSMTLVVIPTNGSTPTPTPTPTKIVTPTPTPQASSCKVSYVVQSQWSGGFTGNITITNTSSTPLSSWALQFTFPNGQQVQQGWNGVFTQSGGQVTIANASYNGTVSPNSAVNLGFNASWTGSNSVPSSFSLNGQTCAPG